MLTFLSLPPLPRRHAKLLPENPGEITGVAEPCAVGILGNVFVPATTSLSLANKGGDNDGSFQVGFLAVYE